MQFTDGGSIPPAAYFFFALVPDTGSEDVVCESDVGDGGRPTGRAGAGGGVGMGGGGYNCLAHRSH